MICLLKALMSHLLLGCTASWINDLPVTLFLLDLWMLTNVHTSHLDVFYDLK